MAMDFLSPTNRVKSLEQASESAMKASLAEGLPRGYEVGYASFTISFELTSLAGNPTAGIFKDVVMLGGYQEAEIDFVVDNPGLTLWHCHQQLHMDFGFMTLFDYR
jgi:hypothetical protein